MIIALTFQSLEFRRVGVNDKTEVSKFLPSKSFKITQ